jgi:uncharacterized protein (TIGR01244 family)
MTPSRLIVSCGVVSGVLAVILAGCAGSKQFAAEHPAQGGLAAAPVEPPVKITYPDPVQDTICQAGPIYIAGQPSEAAMRRLVGEGVTVVINLRTPREMDDRQQVPYDEAALLKELGVDYVYIPIGGKDYPATPEAVDKFATALSQHQGKALLHCTVAWRASHLWAAYLIRQRGVPQDVALAQARSIQPNRPLVSDFLDADIEIVPRRAEK